MILFIFVVFAVTINFVSCKCPEGTHPTFTNPNLCYSFKAYELEYFDAENSCKDFGGHLASIHDPLEDLYLQELSTKYFSNSIFWIGATNLLIPSKWTWLDGTPFDYDAWFHDTTNPENNNHCGVKSIDEDKWFQLKCLQKLPYVCLINAQNATKNLNIKKQ